MFIRKYWIPLSVFIVAIAGVGLYLLATQPPPEPIVIYKAVKPLEKPMEAPTTEAPIGEKPPEAQQGGHFHADGTWHAGPHAPSIQRPDRGDVAVSPHGFGPYPPLPPSWTETPEEIWGNCADPDHELLKRVRIKLLSQGVDVRGGVFDPDTGKVYPSIPGIRYVEWDTTDLGLRYIAGSTGHPDDGDRLHAISEAKFERGEDDILTEADVPPDIQLIPYEEAGIDPYEFLGLTRP